MKKDLFMFDIETCGEYANYETFESEDPRGAKLFKSKYDKMAWSIKYDDVNQAYIENAGIIPTYGKICCISFGYIDNKGNKNIRSFYGDDEKDIVESFNNLLENKIERTNFDLSGFRIFYFDIPWLLHKLHKYDIKPANMIYLYDKKPWDARIVDMSDDWKSKFAWAFTFDEMCYELGVDSPKDKMDGSLVHKSFYEGKYKEIKTYCEKDVSSSIDASIKIYRN